MNRRTTLAALGCVALFGWTQPLRSADPLDVLDARLDVDAGGPPATPILLSAEFRIALNETLRNALQRGLPLYFVADLQLARPRWYWANDTVIQTQLEWRLSYHALTRQYRLASDTDGQGFDSLDEALVAMSRVDARPVGELAQIRRDVRYAGSLQLRLDTSRLPKPFQMTALTNSEWNPQSEWKRFDFTAPTRKSAP